MQCTNSGEAIITRQNRTTLILRGAKITTFLLSAVLVTLMTSGLTSRPTMAESFLYRTTCGLADLLGIKCDPKTPTTNQPSPGKGSSKPTGTNPTPGTTSPNQSPEPTTFTPIDPLPAKDALLPVTPPLPHETVGGLGASSDANYYALASVPNNENGAGVLGASTQTPLQASSQGWKIFGISWYWLLVLMGVVFIGWRVIGKGFKRLQERANQKVLKF